MVAEKYMMRHGNRSFRARLASQPPQIVVSVRVTIRNFKTTIKCMLTFFRWLSVVFPRISKKNRKTASLKYHPDSTYEIVKVFDHFLQPGKSSQKKYIKR